MRWLKLSLRWLLTGLVIGFVAWEFLRQWSSLPADAWHLDLTWLAVCGIVYMLAFLPSFLYWTWCLHRLGQPTPKFAIFRAYFVGHLGKYVPGKALVPILRAALLNPSRIQPAATILAVFYETLTCMAAGCFLVAGLLSMWSEAGGWTKSLLDKMGWSVSTGDWPSQIAAAGFCFLGVAMLVPLVPAGFNRLARWVIRNNDEKALTQMGLDTKALALGIGVGIVNWALLGVSVWTALRAIVPIDWTLSVCGLCILSVTAAVVLGFVSLLPGGLGVREGILALLMTQTGLTNGPQGALAAVLLRLVWMISEVVLAVVLMAPSQLQWLMRRRPGV